MLNNVLLLAAGKGRRLWPLTMFLPKCLIKINKKSPIDIWYKNIDLKSRVFINVFYKKESVINKIHQEKLPLEIFEEEKLLGGINTIKEITLKYNLRNLTVIFVDSISNFKVPLFKKTKFGTIVLCKPTVPGSYGYIYKFKNKYYLDEKPKIIKRNYVYIFSGIIHISQAGLSDIIQNNYNDLVNDFIKKNINNFNFIKTDTNFIDIGTFGNLIYAKKNFKTD
jgi:NDP-sugar pyrophosphorylase family protein